MIKDSISTSGLLGSVCVFVWMKSETPLTALVTYRRQLVRLVRYIGIVEVPTLVSAWDDGWH